ncbi:MAG TPA: hypothetical protein VMC79_12130 [Rectinemataceae bacterium]|nr:hypothetical protein [Rectinemataceae bacterium]
MRARVLTLAVCLVAGALPSIDLAAQVAAPPAPAASAPPVAVLLQVEAHPDSNAALYTDTLAAALMRNPSILSVIRTTGLDDQQLLERAKRDSCSVLMAVKIATEGADLRVEWNLSMADSSSAPSTGLVSRSPPTADELASSFWVNAVNAAVAYTAGARVSLLEVRGPPGAVVEGFGEPFVLPRSGRLVLPLIRPARIVWVASAPGRLPERGVFDATHDGPALVIPSRRWGVDLGFYGLSFGEFRVSYAVSPELEARFAVSQFLVGINLQNSHDTEEPSLTQSFPMVQLGLGAVYYPTLPMKQFRSYLSLDLFARIFSPQGRELFVDPVAPWGIQPAVGMEWGRGIAGRLYFEVGGVFYPWAYPGLMAASLGGNKSSGLIFGGSGWIAGQPGWFLEVPILRMGLRFRL